MQDHLLPIILSESARILRHAVVPVLLWYFLPELGEERTLALTELLAILGSYVAVLGWSWFRDLQVAYEKRKLAEKVEAPAEAGQ